MNVPLARGLDPEVALFVGEDGRRGHVMSVTVPVTGTSPMARPDLLRMVLRECDLHANVMGHCMR